MLRLRGVIADIPNMSQMISTHSKHVTDDQDVTKNQGNELQLVRQFGIVSGTLTIYSTAVKFNVISEVIIEFVRDY